MRIRPLSADISVLPCRTRLPFRFGMHTMTSAPLVTCRVRIESPDGQTGTAAGYSCDLLVPKWFDKDPDTELADDWHNLLAAQHAAIEVLLENGNARADTAFGHWHRMYTDRVETVPHHATDRLVRCEGVSLLERALIDAVCRTLGGGLFSALTTGALGFDPGTLDSTTANWNAAQLPKPGRELLLRHTVGLLDAIEPEDIAAGERIDDGLPECLVEDIRRYGLTHFKIKITDDSDEQTDRLARVWSAIRREVGPDARVTLDGNEQFDSVERFVDLLERVRREARFEGLLEALLLIEQPLPRARTFDPAANTGMDMLAGFAPCIIDEADAGLWALPEARSLGYRGVSIKSCKGVFSAVLNRARCDVWNAAAEHEGDADARVIQSGEDLTTLPLLALQQDLALMATLGVAHVERNGHHYFRGLAHLPPGERASATAAHPDLYREADGLPFLDITNGAVAIGSVLDAPAFGYAGPIDMHARTAAKDWNPESLL